MYTFDLTNKELISLPTNKYIKLCKILTLDDNIILSWCDILFGDIDINEYTIYNLTITNFDFINSIVLPNIYAPFYFQLDLVNCEKQNTQIFISTYVMNEKDLDINKLEKFSITEECPIQLTDSYKKCLNYKIKSFDTNDNLRNVKMAIQCFLISQSIIPDNNANENTLPKMLWDFIYLNDINKFNEIMKLIKTLGSESEIIKEKLVTLYQEYKNEAEDPKNNMCGPLCTQLKYDEIFNILDKWPYYKGTCPLTAKFVLSSFNLLNGIEINVDNDLNVTLLTRPECEFEYNNNLKSFLSKINIKFNNDYKTFMSIVQNIPLTSDEIEILVFLKKTNVFEHCLISALEEYHFGLNSKAFEKYIILSALPDFYQRKLGFNIINDQSNELLFLTKLNALNLKNIVKIPYAIFESNLETDWLLDEYMKLNKPLNNYCIIDDLISYFKKTKDLKAIELIKKWY